MRSLDYNRVILQSDDDHNSSVSDLDSQPRTPKTPYTAEEDTPTKYTNDGLFKIPRDRKDSSTSQNDQDYIIAKRTRSKVSLATTSIETIESTFQPPDISPVFFLLFTVTNYDFYFPLFHISIYIGHVWQRQWIGYRLVRIFECTH